jgi:hypothetical protein
MATRSEPRQLYAPSWVGWLFYVFLAAFFAAGGLVLWSAARWANSLTATRFLMVLGYGLFFGLVVTVVALRSVGRRAAGPARDPRRPWLWRADWASGRCAESLADPKQQLGMVALATPGLLGIPWVVLGALEEAGVYRLWMAAVGYPLALVPMLAVLRGHARRRSRERRFGHSVLTLPRVPIAPGETLSVTLTTGRPLGVSSTTLTVTCLRRVTSGDSDREETIWTESKTAPLGGGCEARVEFALPAELPGTDALGLDTEVLWRLAATAPTPGLSYETSFLLPVFAPKSDRDT